MIDKSHAELGLSPTNCQRYPAIVPHATPGKNCPSVFHHPMHKQKAFKTNHFLNKREIGSGYIEFELLTRNPHWSEYMAYTYLNPKHGFMVGFPNTREGQQAPSIAGRHTATAIHGIASSSDTALSKHWAPNIVFARQLGRSSNTATIESSHT